MSQPATMMPDVNLTRTPNMVMREPTPFVYVERHGPFLEHAPKAWQEFWNSAGPAGIKDLLTHCAGLSRIDLSKHGDEAYIYQAGAMVARKPDPMIHGLQYRVMDGGSYASFLLSGSFMQLPRAYPLAFSILEEQKIKLRAEFCIEVYLNDPATTPEAEWRTEILIPVQA